MNRREFLKALSVIGVSLSIPAETLAQVSDLVIEDVWAEVLVEPRVFYVNAWGALSDRPGLEGFDFTQDRRDLFRLGATPASGQVLVDFVESNSELDNIAWKAHEDFSCDYWRSHGDEEWPWDSWQAWALSDNCDDLVAALDEWLDALPDDSDYTYADTQGLSCRGDALFFFANQAGVATLLGVDASDADHCWSIDHAAVLTIDVEKANAIAEANSVPIRFEKWEV